MNGDGTARWRTCLHEAGHAVAASRLLKRVATAVVFDGHRGAAYYDRNYPALRTFDEALATAAGHEAESLADRHDTPEIEPGPALEVAYPEQAKPLIAQIGQSVPDAVAIARWCIAGIEAQPERWANRFYWLHREARIFVARHREEIVKTATVLFGRGITTLPAEPAQKGIAHVD